MCRRRSQLTRRRSVLEVATSSEPSSDADGRVTHEEMVQHGDMADFEEAHHQNNHKAAIPPDAERVCLDLIREFLASYGFERTVGALNAECLERGLPSPVFIPKEQARGVMDAFHSANGAKFFKLWEGLPSVLHQTPAYKKLTFYLHVHFAVLPLRSRPQPQDDAGVVNVRKGEDFYIEIDDGVETFVLIKDDSVQDTTEEESVDQGGSEDREMSVGDEELTDVAESETSSMDQDDPRCAPGDGGMERLRRFLETKGSEFSGEPELLSYFALPLVSSPSGHPSFVELFKATWMQQVAESLQGFLSAHVVTPSGNGKSPRMLQLVRSEGRQLNRRFQRLHRDHHHLIGLASELTNALERSVQGHAVDLKVTLDKCARVYPELFAARDAKSTAPFELDFRKIKQHLETGSAKARLLLLQALRWRVTRSAPPERSAVLHGYVRQDLLGLHTSSNAQPAQPAQPTHLLASLLFPANALTPHPLQQGAARLVNTLASLRAGRDYLASNDKLLDVMIPCLMEENDIKVDGYTSDMLLAALQKLSLRHKLRVGMIAAGLVEWLIARLAQKTISTYTLEYGCALLMNLCLHNEAKQRCIPLAEQVLKLLARHLGARLPYVNGTLYSLLAEKRINAEAKRMGLGSVLEYHLKNSDGEMHKQFEYILKLHHSGTTIQQTQECHDDENDDTEEMDLLEEELDACDPVPSELSGEDLLYQQYRLVFPPVAQGVMHRAGAEMPIGRPTTPRAHRTAGGAHVQERNTLDTVAECPVAPAKSPVAASGDPSQTAPVADPKLPAKVEEACGFVSRPLIPRTPD